jgi:hypothetical protein
MCVRLYQVHIHGGIWVNPLKKKAQNLLKSCGIAPTKREVITLENEIKRMVFAAVNSERQRCYEYALRCRDEWEKYPALPQNIAVAAEVLADGILTGASPNSVEKFTKAI